MPQQQHSTEAKNGMLNHTRIQLRPHALQERKGRGGGMLRVHVIGSHAEPMHGISSGTDQAIGAERACDTVEPDTTPHPLQCRDFTSCLGTTLDLDCVFRVAVHPGQHTSRRV
jgi:hypothetical protein